MIIGGTIAYTVVVTNDGPSTATNTVLTDPLPDGLTFVDGSSTNGSAVTATGGTVTSNLGTLAVGETVTVTINATVDQDFIGSQFINRATVDSDESVPTFDDETTTVDGTIDLSITKTDSADPVLRGDQLIYTLVVTNAGPNTATNVQVSDTLPGDVTFVTAGGGTFTGPDAGGVVTITVGDIPATESRTVSITTTVNNDAPDQITNTAQVTSDQTQNGNEPNQTNNSTSEPTSIDPQVDLAITKTDSPDVSITPGGTLTYTLTITNNGPSTATNVEITDTYPKYVDSD